MVIFRVGEDLKEMGDFGLATSGYIHFQNNNAFGLSLSGFFVYILGLSDWFRDVVEVSISGYNNYIYESKDYGKYVVSKLNTTKIRYNSDRFRYL